VKFLTDPIFWSTLASIATVLGVVFVISAAMVALRQLKEMTKARHLEAMLQVYEMIGSEAARKNRRFIYTELKSAPEELTFEERELVEKVIVVYERIGKLVESDLVPRDELLEGHCEVILRSWKKLEPYIRHYRKVSSGRHAKHFETLARVAQEYHSKHFPDVNLEIVNVWSNSNTSTEEQTIEAK
jgi:hypothetical protein